LFVERAWETVARGTGGNLAEGADAVKDALKREFGAITIHEGYDVNTHDVLIDFQTDRSGFRVRVSPEYDSDYASRLMTVNLQVLGALLRASKNGQARVTRSGIDSQ